MAPPLLVSSLAFVFEVCFCSCVCVFLLWNECWLDTFCVMLFGFSICFLLLVFFLFLCLLLHVCDVTLPWFNGCLLVLLFLRVLLAYDVASCIGGCVIILLASHI
jgi:hypothetical protein